jgi:hypothetical protein
MLSQRIKFLLLTLNSISLCVYTTFYLFIHGDSIILVIVNNTAMHMGIQGDLQHIILIFLGHKPKSGTAKSYYHFSNIQFWSK